MSKTVYLFLAEGFEEVEALTPVDVLRRAGIDIKMVSTTGKLVVTGAHGISISSDGLFDDFNYVNADMLILPGGLPGADNLNQHKNLIDLIEQHLAQNKWVAAICAAPYILGSRGMLKGKTATCYPGYENQLKGATVTSNNVEVSQNIITSKGVGAAMDFAIEIVAQLTDQNKADALKEKMVISK